MEDVNTRQRTTDFLFVFVNLDTVLWNSTPGKKSLAFDKSKEL